MKKTRTYNKWLRKGRQVSKGSKAVGFNEKGKALFLKSQTIPSANSHCNIKWGEGDFDGMTDSEREFDMDYAKVFDLH
jgi:hypothetical protein